MSDSPKKENKRAPGGIDAAPAAGRKGGPSASPARNASGRRRKRRFLRLVLVSLAIMAAFGLAVVVSVIVTEQPAPTDRGAGGTSAVSNPISILPPQPDGVTVIARQPGTSSPAPAAPVAQGAEIASGFAMDFGSAQSFVELSRRFARIAEENGPANFVRLEPRAVLKETLAGLEARLLVGPFESERDAAEACEVLILPEGITCQARPFEGESIARE